MYKVLDLCINMEFYLHTRVQYLQYVQYACVTTYAFPKAENHIIATIFWTNFRRDKLQKCVQKASRFFVFFLKNYDSHQT